MLDETLLVETLDRLDELSEWLLIELTELRELTELALCELADLELLLGELLDKLDAELLDRLLTLELDRLLEDLELETLLVEMLEELTELEEDSSSIEYTCNRSSLFGPGNWSVPVWKLSTSIRLASPVVL